MNTTYNPINNGKRSKTGKFRPGKSGRSRIRKTLKLSGSISLSLLVVISIALVYSYKTYAKLIDVRLANGYLTSRAGIYSAPRRLRVGQQLTPENLAGHLRRAGYIESDASGVWSGSFTVSDGAVKIRPTRYESTEGPSVIRVEFDRKNRIDDIIGDGLSMNEFVLEPEALTNDAEMKSGTRTMLGFDGIPPLLQHAILSTEDRRFFEHSGVDFEGVIRAALRNAGDDHIGQGGSTITQQLVKNTYLSPERTFKRKFSEAMLAVALERRLSKHDIFALYCNEVYFGQRGSAGVRGVQQASQVYFAKDVKDLTLAECALLAGMIQSPNRLSPERHLEAATARRATVLAGMVRDGAITLDDAAEAQKTPIALAPMITRDSSLAPYFVDAVNRRMDAVLAGNSGVDERGLRVFTTVDLDLQSVAESAVQKQLEKLDNKYKSGPAPQAALVAMDPATGDVLAMVGGRSYAGSQLNRVTDALRQPGSVFKPIVYSAALENGMSPLTMYHDAPQEFRYSGSSVYRPVNYGGGFSMQNVTMRTALIRSLNVVTVDVAMNAGLESVALLAEKFGLQRPQPYPSLALGTSEASPLNMVSAYSAFVNNGERAVPRIVSAAISGDGKKIFESVPHLEKVISPETAFEITDMLSGVIDHGTAKSARGLTKLTAIAGKTGTSRDGWFVGYTPNLVVAVWVGFDDNKQLGMTGAEAALPIWVDFVSNAIGPRPELGAPSFDRPDGIKFVEIDPETGLRAGAACPQLERVALKSEWVPMNECFKHLLNVLPPPLPEGQTGRALAEAQPVEQTDPSSRGNIARRASIAREVDFSGLRTTSINRTSAGVAVLMNDIRVRK